MKIKQIEGYFYLKLRRAFINYYEQNFGKTYLLDLINIFAELEEDKFVDNIVNKTYIETNYNEYIDEIMSNEFVDIWNNMNKVELYDTSYNKCIACASNDFYLLFTAISYGISYYRSQVIKQKFKEKYKFDFVFHNNKEKYEFDFINKLFNEIFKEYLKICKDDYYSRNRVSKKDKLINDKFHNYIIDFNNKNKNRYTIVPIFKNNKEFEVMEVYS